MNTKCELIINYKQSTATKSTTQTHEHLDLETTQPQPPWQIAHGKGERQE